MARIHQETPVGHEFTGKPKKISWERLWTFSGGAFSAEGWPKKNLHTDTTFAQNLGLPTVGASATQYLGHITDLMIDLFGESWLKHGVMKNVRFIKLVADGDVLTAKARVFSKEREGAEIKYHLNLCVENQKGETVLTGSATDTVPVA